MNRMKNLAPFRAALLGACLVLTGLPGRTQTPPEPLRVDGPAALQAALSGAQGGTILLAPGNYGALQIAGLRPAAPVTLRSEVPHRAVFQDIRITDSAGFGFDGLRTEKQFRAERSRDLRIGNCLARSMLYFREIEGLRIEGCDVSGGQYGVLINTVARFQVLNSRIGGVSEDVMRITGDSHDGLVQGNVIHDVIAKPPTHPDLIQLFHSRNKVPSRITIRRNFLRDDPDTGHPKTTAQGIFVSDPGNSGQGYRDILIEENLINTRSSNTIYINGGQSGVVVRNNTLLPGRGDGGALIRLAEKAGLDNSGTTVEGNIAKLIRDETKSSRIGKNFLYGRNARLEALFSGPGARWQDFLPVLGSEADLPGMGAWWFLEDLQAARKAGAPPAP